MPSAYYSIYYICRYIDTLLGWTGSSFRFFFPLFGRLVVWARGVCAYVGEVHVSLGRYVCRFPYGGCAGAHDALQIDSIPPPPPWIHALPTRLLYPHHHSLVDTAAEVSLWFLHTCYGLRVCCVSVFQLGSVLAVLSSACSWLFAREQRMHNLTPACLRFRATTIAHPDTFEARKFVEYLCDPLHPPIPP